MIRSSYVSTTTSYTPTTAVVHLFRVSWVLHNNSSSSKDHVTCILHDTYMQQYAVNSSSRSRRYHTPELIFHFSKLEKIHHYSAQRGFGFQQETVPATGRYVYMYIHVYGKFRQRNGVDATLFGTDTLFSTWNTGNRALDIVFGKLVPLGGVWYLESWSPGGHAISRDRRTQR